ncbi:MAG TPA: AraC family transcriptional regulator [Longilinea sp.]|nr:AraC family transcriptional regulator [Longilinea sp.]
MKYDDRIQRSVDYIDQHLMEDLDLAAIAACSGYSLSHFYKVFPAITGFSLKEFIRNKRLAWAARQLVYTRRRALDIALDCGFDSQAVFSRAFLNLYGVTPGDFRRTRKVSLENFDRLNAFSLQLEERSRRSILPFTIQAEVIERGPIHLVGMEMRTTVAENIDTLCIPRFWQETFIPRLREIPYCITPDVVISYEVTDPLNDSLLHMACVEVNPPEPPPGMLARSLEPGFFAAFTPARVLDPLEYAQLVCYIYGEWFPMSGCEVRADYTMDLNICLSGRDGRTNQEQLSVLVPIHPPHRRIYQHEPSPFAGKVKGLHRSIG